MAISAPDVTRLRSGKHRIELVLNTVPLTPGGGGFSAQINQASFTYPIGQLTVDHAVSITSPTLIGQAISIGTNSADPRGVTWGVIRKIINSTTLAIDAKSLGDSGYAQDIRQQFADDMYIKIYNHRPPWGLLSRINNKSFFKQFDIAYTDQGSSPAPVAVIGPHRQAFVNTVTNKAQLAFDATRSFAWGSKTITGYTWSLGGGSLLSGSLSGSTLTGEFNPGFYVISCTVTDSASKTHTAYRYVFINTRTGKVADRSSTPSSLPYGYLRPWEITGDRQDQNGRSLDITLYGNLNPTTDNYTFTAPVAELYPGQGFLITEYAYFGDETLADDSVRVSSYFGYISDTEINYEKGAQSTTITLHSPMELANLLPAATQQITEVTSPTNWTQVTNALSNPAGAAWYILQHHAPNLLAMHDFIVPSTVKTLRKQSFVFQSDSIGGQLEQLKELMLGNIGCRSDGSIVMSQSPMYMNNTDRNALDNKFSWNEGDVLSPLHYPRTFQAPVGQAKGYAFSYNGGSVATPYASLAPGKSQGQGTGKKELTVIVRQSEGQTRLNEITGHHYAQEARVTDNFITDVDNNIDIAEPVDANIWHTMVIPATYDPMRIGWSNIRVIPKKVTRQWTKAQGGFFKKLSIEWQPETFGLPGVTIPVERGGADTQTNDDGTIIDTKPPYDPKFADAYALPWNSLGQITRTNDFNSSAPHFELMTADLLGSVNDVALDFGSEYIYSGVGELGVWVVTTSGNTLRVYYAPDIRTVLPTWTLQKTYTMADSTVTSSARIASSRTAQDSVITAWKDGTGTRYGYTTNGGTSWSSAAYVQPTFTDDPANDNAELGLAVDGTNILVSAYSAGIGYQLYRASSFGGSWTLVSSTPASDAPFPMIAVDGSGNAYCTIKNSTGFDVSDNITFDGGGTPYSIANLGGINPRIDTGGNGGNCYRNTYSSTGTVQMSVTRSGSNWNSPHTPTSASMDVKYEIANINLSSISLQIEYYDNVGSLISTYTATTLPGMPGWTTITDPSPPAGVYSVTWRVVFTISSVPGGSGDMYIDNCICNI